MSDTTLAFGATVITLPAGLLRTDAYGYSPVRQSVTATLDGVPWVDVSVAASGAPITLSGGRSGGNVYGDMTRGAFAALRALADLPGQVFTLTHNGAAYVVIWRHEEPPALDAKDLVDYADPGPDDLVIPTLKFTRVA